MDKSNDNQVYNEEKKSRQHMKECKYCHNDMPLISKKCPHCKRRQNKGEIIVIVIGILFAVIVLSFIIKIKFFNNIISKNTYALGDTFEFDNFEITIDKKYSFVKTDDILGNDYGKYVIKVPVTVKNLSDEKQSLNSSKYSLFGSTGVEADIIAYQYDDSIDRAAIKELRPGGTYKKYFYILYDGDGIYSIDFDNYLERISVEFNVKK